MRFVPTPRVVTTSLTLGVLLGSLLPSPAAAQFSDSSDGDNLGVALGVYGLSIAAAWLLFNPPEPAFTVSGADLATSSGQSRLEAYDGPVGVRRSGFGKWAVRSADDIGMVTSANGSGVSLARAGESNTVAADDIGDVSDLASAAIRAKELRTSLAIFAFGSAATVFLLADDQTEAGGSKTLLQLSAAAAGALGVYMLVVPSPTEKAAQEFAESGRLSVRPNLMWDRDRGIGLGVVGRLTW